MLGILLHDDDALLKCVLLVDLLLELSSDERVGVPSSETSVASSKRMQLDEPRILFRVDSHRSVLEHRDTSREVGDHLRAQFPLLRDRSGQFSGILLNILDVRLEFGSKLLEMLDNGSLDRLGEIGVVVGDEASLLSL